LIVLSLLILVLLIRFALVDSAVVLGGASPWSAWRRAPQLAAGPRRSIPWSPPLLLRGVFGIAGGGGPVLRPAPGAAPPLGRAARRSAPCRGPITSWPGCSSTACSR